jgi:hypothetical protein
MSELKLRAEGLKWRQMEEEVVALDVDSSTYVSANASGTVLWEALAEGTTRDALVDRLVEKFGIDRDQAGADVDEFVADLRARGLLQES